MRATNRDEAERVVRLPLAELRDELVERLRWGGQLTEESTLEHVAETVTLSVAVVARPFEYEAPREGFGPDADDMRWKAFGETVRTAVLANMVDPNAAAWVRSWCEAVVDGEFHRQRLAWVAAEREAAHAKVRELLGPPPPRSVIIGSVSEIGRIADRMIAALSPAEQAALDARFGIKPLACQAVEDESRLDGRCACGTLPSMKPCEVCRGA